MEHFILDQLFPFERNGVIALIKIYNDLVINPCMEKLSLLVLLDLYAAFDTVDHQMLLENLQSFSVRDNGLSSWVLAM